MKHVLHFSGGLSSWATGKVVAEKYGTDNLILLFADTKYEDPDLYRFLHEAATNIGGQLVILQEGRDVWQVFKDERFIGNSRVDPCSKILKRQVLDKWAKENCVPTDIHYIGYRWDEKHRFQGYVDSKGKKHEGLQERAAAKGMIFEAPLIDLQHLGKPEVQLWCEREGLDPPATYDDDLGGNCGGRCIKQGQKHWAQLLRVRRDSYLEVENKEEEMRQFLGKDVSILKDRRGGTKKPLTLLDFRKRIEDGGTCDNDGTGGCRCMDD